MTPETILAMRRLFLDTRNRYWEGQVPPDTQFAEALTMLGDSRADMWMRYCCQKLRVLVQDDRRVAHEFADAVHNSVALEGLPEGLLKWPKAEWDVFIEPFRDQYGKEYFSDFICDVLHAKAEPGGLT